LARAETRIGARAGGSPSGAALLHRQPLLAVEPIDAVLARRLALAAQQDEQPAIAETAARVRQFAQALAKGRVRRSPRPPPVRPGSR